MQHLLAIDQGTTSTRAIIYDDRLRELASARRNITQYFPEPGRVEHDANEIWDSVLETARSAILKAGIKASDIAAIGITNQRETTVVWDRKSGAPVHPAICWQDRRTADYMDALREAGKEPLIRQRSGLILDPYFSAGKLHWILRDVPDGRRRAESGELAAGTVDSWLIYKLTAGRSHITDVTNASRTMLMDIRTGAWDPELLALFDIPPAILPKIVSSSGDLAVCDDACFGAEIPITAAIGDQQSALFGQLCTRPGLVKCTYGTGCFLLEFTGSDAVASANRLLTTVAWKIGDAPIQFALEGSVFIGGAAIQWLRDGVGLIKSAGEVSELAMQVSDSGDVVMVPAFTGLGAPYWDSAARGAMFGISRGTTAAHLARATLDGIAFQVCDLVSAMEKDSGRRITEVRVDGGAAASDLLMQLQADYLGSTVNRPLALESTALGAAMLAGLTVRVWDGMETLASVREQGQIFHPTIPKRERLAKLKVWKSAVKSTRAWRG